MTGAPPNGVAYNDGLQDILLWTSNVPGNPAPGAPPNTGPAPGAAWPCPGKPCPGNTRLVRLQISRAISRAGRFVSAGIPRGRTGTRP